jgi:transposase
VVLPSITGPGKDRVIQPPSISIAMIARAQIAFCWAHTRRRPYDVLVTTKSPIAEEALQRIAALYAIESGIRGEPAEERQRARQQKSRPLVEATYVWVPSRRDGLP